LLARLAVARRTERAGAAAALHDQWKALVIAYPKRGFEAIEEDARHAGQEFGMFKQDFLVAAVKFAGTVPTKSDVPVGHE
jgi:hypothetical protein